jgi:fumarylacetoacetate (FAA) hydrolase
MKLVQFLPDRPSNIWRADVIEVIERVVNRARKESRAPDPSAGLVCGDEVVDLRAMARLGLSSDLEMLQGAAGMLGGDPPTQFVLLGLVTGDLHKAAERIQAAPARRLSEWTQPLTGTTLLAPVQPGSFRDFYAFEEHVRNARRRRGLDMVPEWYEAPTFYFSNVASILGPGAPMRKPPETNELDYELEIAAVIGHAPKECCDVAVEEADGFIAGFTILNDWSARDVQRREMKVGLGPAKGKDFATSIGPYLVTPDELEECVLPDRSRGKRYDLAMTASVNGKEYSHGNARDMRWTFAELIAHASRNTTLRPGDLIGSGTVGTGCITEFPEGTHPWLQPGDVVRLEIEGLGVLENTVSA